MPYLVESDFILHNCMHFYRTEDFPTEKDKMKIYH